MDCIVMPSGTQPHRGTAHGPLQPIVMRHLPTALRDRPPLATELQALKYEP